MTTTRPVEYENLIKTSKLEAVRQTPGAVAGFVKNAKSYLSAAQTLEQAGAESLMVFTNAYEGFYALVQAVLEHYEVRTKDSGRNLAILRVCADLGLSIEDTETARRAHEVRNHTAYRAPFPPVTRRQASDLVDLLTRAIPLANSHVAASNPAGHDPALTTASK